MKIFLFLIILLFFSQVSNVDKVVNSCGNDDHKTTGKMPNEKEDCKDLDEPACRLVNITKNGQNKRFCAIIHGKYNDKDVINEIKKLIKADYLDVLESSFIKNKYIFFIFSIFLFY